MVVQHDGTSLACHVATCSFISSSINVHLAHLKSHLLSGVAIDCPFKNAVKNLQRSLHLLFMFLDITKNCDCSFVKNSNSENVSDAGMLNSLLNFGDSNDECINEDNFDCDVYMGVITEDRKSEFLNNIVLFKIASEIPTIC